MKIHSINNSVLGIKNQGGQKKIEEGDTIKGKVIDISKNSVMIKTSTGQTISASFNNSFELYLGQPIELLVNNIFKDQAFAELKNSNNTKLLNLNERITDILNETGIPVRQDTISFAKMLLKNDMAITKETMQRIIELQSSIKNLNQNITPEKIISLLLISDKANDIPTDILNRMILLNQNNIKEAYGNEEINMKSFYNESSIKGKILGILKDMNISIDDKMSNLVSKITSILEGLSSNNIKDILLLMSNDINVTPKNLIGLANNVKNEIKIGDILNRLLDKIEGIESNDEELLQIKNSIKELFITPEKLQDSAYLESKMQNIFMLGKMVEENLNKNNYQDIEFNKLLNEIRDKLDFVKVVNKNNNYLHMPLLLNNQKSTLDIYIVNNNKNQKGKKRINENTTVLISLDLNNIGYIESMITIERKNVSLVFRTDDNMIKDLICSKLIPLNHLLREKGYVLIASKVTDIDERFSLNTISNIQQQNKTKDFHLDLRV